MYMIYIENSSLVLRRIPALMLEKARGLLCQEAGHELENSTEVLSMSD
jgi:hypothetical protein